MLLALYYLFFVYREDVLGLISQLHLSWSRHTLFLYWGGGLTSRQKLLSWSNSAGQVDQSILSRP